MLDEKDRDELVPVLTALAGGASLTHAAAKAKLTTAQLLELAMMDPGFALALIVAQHAAADFVARDLCATAQGIATAAEEIAANAGE